MSLFSFENLMRFKLYFYGNLMRVNLKLSFPLPKNFLRRCPSSGSKCLVDVVDVKLFKYLQDFSFSRLLNSFAQIKKRNNNKRSMKMGNSHNGTLKIEKGGERLTCQIKLNKNKRESGKGPLKR